MALNKDRVFKAAENYIKKNRIDKAITEYESWLKENPKDWNIIRTVGDLYARISRNDEAIKKYAQVADHYRKDGFNVRAIATYKMVLRLDPQNEPAMKNLAELQAEEGLLMEAKSYYQTLVELYNKQGHKRAAAEVFKKLAEIDPQDVKIRYKYADFLNKNGKPDEASREYVGIADAFIGQGLVDEAIKILEQGRSLQTSSPALKIKLAEACSMQGNHAQAIRLLEEVRRSAAGDPAILGRLGEAYLAAGNTDDAQVIFQELAAVQPGNPENLLRLADLRIAQSKFDTALEELSPLVDRYVAQGEGKKAAELLSKVLSKDAYHVKTLLKLAEIHTILKQDSGRVAAYDSLCEAYSRAGDYQKAVSVAEQLVELDPESSQHKDRLKFFKSKLAGPARAPEPAAKPAAPPPRPAAPAPKPAPPAPAPRVEARPASAPLPRPTAPAPPPRPAPAPMAPISEISEIPDFGSFGDDLGQAVEGGFSDLNLDEPTTSEAAASIDLGEVVELTQEEEENIKEKLTEAEVFVRYGLVDKAIGQLVDVLESFRYHAETREKLIEIYKDQGMNHEAGEQLAQLSQVYQKLGRSQEAGRARQEASELNPALASRGVVAELAVEEEPELILAPETESDLGDAGIEIDIAPMDEDQPVFSGMGPQSDVDIPISFDDASFEEPSIDIRLDEPSKAPAMSAPLAAEIPVEVDWGAAAGDFAGSNDLASSEDSIDLTGAVEVEEEEFSVSLDDELPEEVEFASPAHSEELRIESDSEDIEINLEASSADIPISIEEPAELLGSREVSAVTGLDEEFEVEIGEEVEASAPAPAFEEEFSVDLGEDEEPAADIAVSLPESEAEETFSPSFDASSGDVESDFHIEIPSSVDEVDLTDLSNLGMEDEEAIEIEEPPEPNVPVRPAVEPKRAAAPATAPAKAAAPRPEPPPAPPPKATPAPAPRPSPPPARSPVAAELGEVDEYIALGLYEDARDSLRDLLKKHPGQAEILAKIEELGFSSEQIQKEAKEPARLLKTPVSEPPRKKTAPAPELRPRAEEPEPVASSPAFADEMEIEEFTEASLGDELESLVDLSEPEPAAAARPAAETDFIDLASELSEEIFGTHSAVEEEDAEPEGPLTDPGLDQIFREFRKGVEKQLGAEDYDTRYNLGIAYKEMGLLDEAIAEFQLAAKDEVRSLECCSMLGLCFIEKGMPDIAIKWFSKGLAIPGRREEEYHGLRYDLAQAYEAAGQPERALELYMEIFRENIKFRDVQERVKELQAARK